MVERTAVETSSTIRLDVKRAIDTVNKPYANATATTQETVSRVLSSNFSSIDEDGEILSSCSGGSCTKQLPSSFPLVSNGRMHRKRRTGRDGVHRDSATAGRLRLGLLGLEVDALGSSAFLARDRDNQLFLGLGRRRVRAKTAC